MKAVGCIATLCLLVTTYLGTCQGASTTDAGAVVTTDAGAVVTTDAGAVVTTAAPAQTTAAPPVAVGVSCSGGKTCDTGLVCDTTCKREPGGDCTGHADYCQTGTTCTANACTLNPGVVGFACTDNINCTAANSECDTTTTHTCKCKSDIKTNPINLQCPSGSATVMASVLVLAVAFVKTQLF